MAAGGSRKVVIAAMACNAGIAAAKFAAATFTGSSAMLSEAIHSLIDTSNQALLMHGLNRAERPADARHPFGHGRELYFWSFIVAILLFGMGAGVSIYEGIEKLAHPKPLTDPHVNYIVLGVAFLLEAGSAWVAITEFNRLRGDKALIPALRASKDPSIFTVLLEDMAALAGLVAAFLGILVAHVGGVPEGDGIASIVIGAILALVAAFIAVEVKSLLTGEAASEDLQVSIAGLIGAEVGATGIRVVNDIRTLQLGAASVLVAASVDVSDGLTSDAVEALTGRLDAAIRARHPEVRHVYVDVRAAAAGRAQPLEVKSIPAPNGSGATATAAAGPASSSSGSGTGAKPASPPRPHPSSKKRRGRRR